MRQNQLDKPENQSNYSEERRGLRLSNARGFKNTGAHQAKSTDRLSNQTIFSKQPDNPNHNNYSEE